MGLVKRGICFVVTMADERAFFSPSRFIGYVGNSLGIHEANEQRDGRDTNPAIASVLKQDWTTSKTLDAEYRNFCQNLGFIARERGTFGIERKFIDIR